MLYATLVKRDGYVQKLSKEQAAAFVDLLRDLRPAITSTTSLDDIESVSGQDERWFALPDDKRQVSLPSCFWPVGLLGSVEHAMQSNWLAMPATVQYAFVLHAPLFGF